MPNDDVTVGELMRRFDSMSRDVDRRFDHLGDKIDALRFVSQEVYSVQMTALDERVHEVEEWKRFAVRWLAVSIVAPLIVALVVALIVAGGR
jgi:hypothetical protein